MLFTLTKLLSLNILPIFAFGRKLSLIEQHWSQKVRHRILYLINSVCQIKVTFNILLVCVFKVVLLRICGDFLSKFVKFSLIFFAGFRLGIFDYLFLVFLQQVLTDHLCCSLLNLFFVRRFSHYRSYISFGAFIFLLVFTSDFVRLINKI